MDTGPWRATAHGVANESDMTEQLNNNNKEKKKSKSYLGFLTFSLQQGSTRMFTQESKQHTSFLTIL